MAGNFVVENRQPVVAADRGANWDNDAIQFARLIAALETAGYFSRDTRYMERKVCQAMDIESPRFAELVERAKDVAEWCEKQLPKRKV